MNEESLKQPSPLREVDSCTSGDTCLPWSKEGEIFNAKAYEKACARILRWTREKPTQPGWYWWRHDGQSEIVYLTDIPIIGAVCSTMFGSESVKLKDLSGEWAGPVPEPEDA